MPDQTTHKCFKCGEEWKGSHVCPPREDGRPRPTDPQYIFGYGGKHDAAIWGP